MSITITNDTSPAHLSCFRFPEEININDRTSHDIDMKLGPVIKLDKRKTATLKKLTKKLCWQVTTSLSFFRLIVNLDQFKYFRPSQAATGGVL